MNPYTLFLWKVILVSYYHMFLCVCFFFSVLMSRSTLHADYKLIILTRLRVARVQKQYSITYSISSICNLALNVALVSGALSRCTGCSFAEITCQCSLNVNELLANLQREISRSIFLSLHDINSPIMLTLKRIKSCYSSCRLSLKKPPSLKFLLDPQKYRCSFLFVFTVLLKRNCLYLVCYAAVRLGHYLTCLFCKNCCRLILYKMS